MTALDHALAYAGRGWHVFVLSNEKIPLRNCDPCHYGDCDREACTCLTCHGFYAATTDPGRIRAMFDRHPDNPVAIRTGNVSGLIVVEVDPKNGGEATLIQLDERGALPGTLMVQSGGGGIHLYYAHPGGYIMGGAHKMGRGVDVKADGGYVVAPPSLHKSGHRYAWTGDGRFDYPLPRLAPYVEDSLRPVETEPHEPFVTIHATRARGRFAGALDRLRAAIDGERNSVLLWASQVAGEMVAAGQIGEDEAVTALQHAAASIGLTRTESGDQRKGTIGSGMRRGRGKVGAA